MTIILFLVVLAILIFIHELGHFIVAKKSGIRVDEFAIGFPPKILSWVRGETKYVLNLIPFGGYVKIFGENPDDESLTGVDSARSFVNAKRWKQICVLLAGITMNIIFAWVLISASFMFGSMVPVGEEASNYSKYIKDTQIVLVNIIPGSPAEKAGLKLGDKLISVASTSGKELTVSGVIDIIKNSTSTDVVLTYSRSGDLIQAKIVPEYNQTENRKVIGIVMQSVGIVRLNPVLALWEGGKLTIANIQQVAVGLSIFLWHAVIGQADFSQVSGPVGIVGMVGDAATFGLAYFLGFIAIISLNLAVINLIPFPALDGGRVLFSIIEIIIRRPIKPIIANSVNTIGFFVLIALMLIITYKDILKFF
jgi:regulator of sigma E protease